MADKKFSVPDDDMSELDFNPEEIAARMPVNITNGLERMDDYVYIPTDKIVPFLNKQGSDFSRMPEDRFQQFINTIKRDGVIEAVTVRPCAGGKFELLAGETRWSGIKAAGIKKTPCHLLRDCDDDRARRIYSLTNLNRRSNTVRDTINGWWHYYESLKGSSDAALKKKLEADEVEIEQLTGTKSRLDTTHLSGRQIRKYHKIHSLPDVLLDRVEQGLIPLEASYILSFLSPEQQDDLCQWAPRPISVTVAERMRELAESGAWSKVNVDKLFSFPSYERTTFERHLSNSVKKFRRIIQGQLNPAAAERIGDIVEEAMNLYFAQHPEDKAPEPVESETEDAADI